MAKDVLERAKETTADAKNWVAAEYKYMRDAKSFLTDLKEHFENAKKDIRLARRALNYVGRAEYRAGRKEEELLRDLRELANAVPVEMRASIDNVEREIEIIVRQLVKQSSRYTGSIRKMLDDLSVQVELVEKGEGNAKVVEEIIDDIVKKTDDVLQWYAALETDLRKAEEIEKKIEEWVKG